MGGMGLSVRGTLGAVAAPGVAGDPGSYAFNDRHLSPSTTTSVNIANGNLKIQEDDLLASAASYDVFLSRTYNSQGGTGNTGLGPRWAFDVGPNVRLAVTASQATVYGPTGSTAVYIKQSDGSFATPDDGDLPLAGLADGSFRLGPGDDGLTYAFGSDGTLQSVSDSAGNTFTVATTSAAGATYLSSSGTASGRRANLSYNGVPRTIEVDDPASNHRYYGYDGQGRLVSYQGPDGQTTYGYDVNGLLDSITVPGGVSETFAFDSSQRVTSVSITRSGVTTQTTYRYDAAAAPCASTDAAATTQTDDGGTPVVWCSDADGTITSYHDPAADADTDFSDGPSADLDEDAGACYPVDGEPLYCGEDDPAAPTDDGSGGQARSAGLRALTPRNPLVASNYGISDNNPLSSFDIFSDPAFKGLNIKKMRRTVPYNVALVGGRKARRSQELDQRRDRRAARHADRVLRTLRRHVRAQQPGQGR